MKTVVINEFGRAGAPVRGRATEAYL